VLKNRKLLAGKVKWTKEDCSTEDRSKKGLRCRFGRVAALLCFLVVALLLVTLAFGSFVKRKPVPPTVKVSGATAITLQHHV
jgi:hypothetical protein